MKISVVLTSYNHGAYIGESIKSILNQTYKDYEFIIVDDFSVDSSWETICHYRDANPNIIAIRHDHNWGSGTLEDIVNNYATGDYIALHHSDDVWAPDKLERQVKAFQEHPECAAIFTNAIAINEKGEEYNEEDGFYFNLFETENRSRHEWLNHFFFKGNCLCHPSILIKKSAYMEDGFFRKGLRQIPDFVKWIQLCKKHEIYVLPQPLVKFRVHLEGKNASGMRADTQVRSTVELFLMLQEYASIEDKEEFLKIFPKAQQYCTGEFYSTRYVLARICMEEGMPSYTRLFGVQLMYDILNHPDQAELIEKQYHYTKKTFMENNGKYDIFGVLPEAFEQIRTLYIDRGHGFNCEDSCREKYTMGETYKFNWLCKVTNSQSNPVKTLRYDPSEGILVKVKIDDVTVSGIEVKFYAENALCEKDGWQVFVNLDPIYTIEMPKNIVDDLDVHISGEIKRLSHDDIGQSFNDTFYAWRHSLYDCQNKLQKIEEQFCEKSLELDTVQTNYENLEKLDSQKTTRIKSLEEDNTQKNIQIQHLQSCNNQKEEQIQLLENRNTQNEMQIQQLEQSIDQKKEQLRMLELENNQLDTELRNIKATKMFRLMAKTENILLRLGLRKGDTP